MAWVARSPEGEPQAGREIRVTQSDLIAFAAAKTRSQDVDGFTAEFAALSAEERRRWLELFVREEALVREARRLELDRDDDLIRRRLVQMMEFLAIGAESTEAAPGSEELAAFFREHREDYRIPTTLSFSHVFLLPRAGETPDAFRGRAQSLVDELNRAEVTPDGALERGDRFLYNRNYVDRTAEEVVSHFGAEAARQIARETPAQSLWLGPLRSEHGMHAIWLERIEQTRLPPLEEVTPRVRADFLRTARERALDRRIGEIVSRYEVDFVP